MQNSQATWGGRFSEKPSDLMTQFSNSLSFDACLAPFDIRGSIAYAKMLREANLITKDESDSIGNGLEQISADIEAGSFIWKAEYEDVHMNIEQALTQLTPAGAKLHTARSRNEQIAVDMRLFFKTACLELHDLLSRLLKTLIDFAENHIKVAIPGYTHLQRAQPVLLAHHILAYAEMFERDRKRCIEMTDHANYCPLGSGALAGTTLPIMREFLAKELGFVDTEGHVRITRNSMDAVADRDLFVEFVTACALMSTHLSRLAEDIILWNSSEFSFVVLPEQYTTGSSLMPQKKNPDALELIRGKSARIQAHIQTLMTLQKGLPMTYNRDLQEDKIPVFDAYQQTTICLLVMTNIIAGTVVNLENCRLAVADPLLLATDLTEYLVEQGFAFRDAHHAVGSLVAYAKAENISITEIGLTEARKRVPQLPEDWLKIFDLNRSFKKKG